MYHIFIIQSLAKEHFGCFHFLPVVNKAVMNICGVGCQVLWAHAKECYICDILGFENSLP